ncbi:ABC transporter substrate-binding protein, partial [Corynebacterium hesseae]
MPDVEIRTAMTPGKNLYTLNSKNEILSDIKVREAIMTGIDRATLSGIRFNGLNGYTEDLPGSFNLYQTQKGYEDNVGAVISFDPEKAKSLLDEAGWKEGGDGIREKDGKKLSMRYTLLGDSSISKAMATATQKMMKDIGVDLKVEERPVSDFSEITSKYDFDILPMGFSSGDPFGVAYFGQTYRSGSQLNRSGTGTPELDKKIDELSQIADPDEQIKKSNELEKEALAQYGIIPIFNGPTMVATHPDIANFGANSFAVIEVENIGYTK